MENGQLGQYRIEIAMLLYMDGSGYEIRFSACEMERAVSPKSYEALKRLADTDKTGKAGNKIDKGGK